MALAAKIIASRTTRAGLVGILGSTGKENVQGEEVQKLDQFAQRTIYRLNDHTGRLAVMASEEEEAPIPIPERFPAGNYVLVFDPLDGSSNIDFNVSIGTIFAIYRRKTPDGTRGTLEDCLQAGQRASGRGLCRVRLQHDARLQHGPRRARLHAGPQHRRVSAVAPGHPLSRPSPSITAPTWATRAVGRRAYRRYTRWLQGEEAGGPGLSLRYIGSLVADFHRNLLTGGVFYYPADGGTAAATRLPVGLRPSRGASCGCCTRRPRSRSWRSRRAATAPTAAARSWIWSRKACTSVCPCMWAAGNWSNRRRMFLREESLARIPFREGTRTFPEAVAHHVSAPHPFNPLVTTPCMMYFCTMKNMMMGGRM